MGQCYLFLKSYIYKKLVINVLFIIIDRYIQMGVNGSRQIHIKNVEEHYNKC